MLTMCSLNFSIGLSEGENYAHLSTQITNLQWKRSQKVHEECEV